MQLAPRQRFLELSLAAIALLLVAAAPAAASHEWQVAPAGCMPDETNHSETGPHWAAGNDGSMSFLLSETGVIQLRCAITNPADDGSDPDWDQVEVGIIDTSTVMGNHVQLALRRVSKLNGAIATELIFDSNSFDPTGDQFELFSDSFGTVFDFDNFFYFLEIQLSRTNGSVTESVLFVGFV